MDIKRPSVEEVQKYLDKWETLEDYARQDHSLRRLFTKTYPQNNCIDEVLVKVGALNIFYSTNIRFHKTKFSSTFTVAKHIVDVNKEGNINERLKSGDLSLVNKIANVDFDNKVVNLYSFATKYCNHHFSEDSETLEHYPIYDSLVVKMLKHFKKEKDEAFTFNEGDLKDYKEYREILKKFRKHYGLTNFSLRKLDKYLWQLGREAKAEEDVIKKAQKKSKQKTS